MIRRLKHLLYKLPLPLWRLYARARRATLHSTVRFHGRPLIRCAKGATLELAEDVVIHSAMSANPLIGRRSSLCAAVAGAVLRLDKGVGASGVSITAASEVTIGAGTIIGADCLITDTDFHLPTGLYTWSNSLLETSKPVHIGKGCFLGARCIILKGVTIGDGSIIGAGAVVTRDVPAEHLAAGNPATVTPLPERWRQSAAATLRNP